ncbi:MAG TPA: DNA-directed RNA polymerase subunit omega [Bacillota bacterium]|nr:DNA-directed RNA polymerase subunit omega [Bacillota bacterium]
MIYPTLDDLLKHVDNRFTLVTVSAKRARQIIEKERADDDQSKAVTTALEEIVDGKTRYQRTKSGIK